MYYNVWGHIARLWREHNRFVSKQNLNDAKVVLRELSIVVGYYHRHEMSKDEIETAQKADEWICRIMDYLSHLQDSEHSRNVPEYVDVLEAVLRAFIELWQKLQNSK